MAISYKVWDFPRIPVRSQLFYAAGQAYDGGFTSGGARLSSPEPGGRSFLEMQLSLQTTEWDAPFSSWLMSKLNGDIFSVRLTKTPQLISDAALGAPDKITVPWAPLNPQSSPTLWNNSQPWSGDGVIYTPSIISLEGSTTLVIDVSITGPVVKHGHVIGVGSHSYMVDDIEYNDNIATITVNPPLRRDVTDDDYVLTRPYFLGQIINGQEFKATYEAANVGHIQTPRLIFAEVII